MATQTIAVNLPAPEFTLESGAGQRVSLRDFRGRPVVLYFIREFT